MKKILLSLLAGAITCIVNGQIAVTGISPASVQGNYNFTIGDATQSWAPALDFSTPGVYVQGELVIVNDGSTGTNPQGNPISAEGCNTLVNAAAVNGKIAVIYRNTCNFGVKALNAQDAGAIAVIILNRDPEVIGMNGGAEGLNVTIPVVMLSSLDGLTLTNAMQSGPVEVFIGNKAGLYPNDLALNEELIAVPQYHGVHSLLAQNGSEFNVDLGLRVYNFGSATQTNAMANVTITGPSGAEVYNEDVTFSLNGVSGNAIDSVDIFPGETLMFPQFALATYPAGKYTLTYTLINGGGVDDDFPNDNTYSIDFVVNDSYLSRSRLDATTLKPIAESQVKPAAPTTGGSYAEVVYCSSFRNANASRLAVLGFNATVSVDSVDANSTLEGKFVFADLYEWTNADAVYAANAGNTQLAYNLDSKATLNYDFVNDVIKEEVYFEFESPVLLADNTMYMVCITDFGQDLNIGYDRAVRYNVTRQLTSQWINPLKVVEGQTVTWYGAGFGADLTPAFGIRAIDVETASVEDLLKLEGKAYPNPTNDVVRMIIPLDGKATVAVTDLSGRTVANREVNFTGNQASIDLAELQSGMYVIHVAYNNGSKSTFNVIKK
ncbi:T9SS type A sorting domain-containing protein [Crocinitomicaceae bacterium CZZ-1]|uniref:T9SS type A sorting domain-containing protein n=1 Tax=Taishania pollutisoli TaxID=2766479 RepID=A0A8J6PI30_9FLAO|nr:T9SS type A sorting domain-containing protein [Taishania pollutisoli]MBC9811984.1 T9SS type A sorting domain-containing protein [Taishania pollutisoli]